MQFTTITRMLMRQTPRVVALVRGRIASPTSSSAMYMYNTRYLSSATAEQVVEQANVDHVRDAIRRLLTRDSTKEEDAKPISNKELEQNLARFANRFREARACMNDCAEAKAGSLEFYEELFTAKKSVDNAFDCYVDLLDDFRRASDDQLKSLCQDRLGLAHALRGLRKELDQLAEPKQNIE